MTTTIEKPVTIEKKKQPSDFLSVRQVADHLGVGRTLVYGLMDAGDLAYVKIGKTRRIHRETLGKFIEAHTVGA